MAERTCVSRSVFDPDDRSSEGRLFNFLQSLRRHVSKASQEVPDTSGSNAADQDVETSLSERTIPDDVKDIEQKIIRQMEYYFGNHNLPKDKFMQESMDEEGWITLSTLLTFRRLALLSTDPIEIMDSVEKSSKKLIEIDRHFVPADGQIVGRVRRNPSQPLPTLALDDFRDRTLRIEGFPPSDTFLDDVILFFETNFDQCIGVKQWMRNRDENDKTRKEFRGIVLATFSSKEAARDFMEQNRRSLIYNGHKLKVSLWCDRDRVETTDTFKPEVVGRTVYVAGFDKVDTSLDELETFFGNFDNVVQVEQRKSRLRGRDFRFAGSAFVEFRDPESALKFMALSEVRFQGDKLIREWQLEFYKRKGMFKRQIEESFKIPASDGEILEQHC